MKKLLCKIFGHKWLYNFKTMPSKAICSRCKCKAKENFRYAEWEYVDNFGEDKRSDAELISKWVEY